MLFRSPGFLGGTKGTEGDPVTACLRFFARSLDIAARAGVPEDRIALDPGLGFGKTVEQNFALVARLAEFGALGLPLLIGASRKSFLRRHTGREVQDSLFGTLALHMAAALHGAAILRVHDVAEHVDGVKVAAALRREALARGARP